MVELVACNGQPMVQYAEPGLFLLLMSFLFRRRCSGFFVWWFLERVVFVFLVPSVSTENGDSVETGHPLHPGRPLQKKDLPSTQWKSLKNSKYLTYLFRKYGSGGVITFEVGFARLARLLTVF